MNFFSEGKKYLKIMEDRVKEKSEKNKLLLEFKEKTGLKGPELKKAFEEYWNNANPKECNEYYEIPKNIKDEELIYAIERLRNTYKTFKKRGAENRFLENRRGDEIFEDYKKYILPKSDLLTPKSKKSKSCEEGEIMKGCSDLKKKGDKYQVETELNVKEGLEPKVKLALIKSIIIELNNNFNDYEFFYKIKN
jgi:hypothetical protein